MPRPMASPALRYIFRYIEYSESTEKKTARTSKLPYMLDMKMTSGLRNHRTNTLRALSLSFIKLTKWYRRTAVR